MIPSDADAAALPLSLVARILVVDAFGTPGLRALREAGCDAIHNPALSERTLANAMRDLDPDILIVHAMRVDEATLAASERLGLVVCTAPTTDAIAVNAASRRGIFVSHCPGRSAAAVAEMVFGLAIASDRRLIEACAATRAGSVDPPQGETAAGLVGRTLGIVGLGHVGQEVAKRGQAFGMQVVAWSRNITEARCDALGVDYCANLVNLAKLADVVSVCVSANEESDGLIGEKFFNALRPGSIVINTSPPSTLNEAALLNAVRTRSIRAWLDLHALDEAARSRDSLKALLSEPAVIATATSSALTRQAREAVEDDVVRAVGAWLAEGVVNGCVNRATGTNAVTLIHVRHLNVPGALAGVFDVLGRAGINVEEMENVICAGGEAGIARIHVSATPTEGQVVAIRGRPHVLGVTVQAINPEPRVT